MDYLDRIKKMLARLDHANADSITAETSLSSDLNMDSFMLMDAVTALEEEFGITIPDRDLRKFGTAGDVAKYLAERCG